MTDPDDDPYAAATAVAVAASSIPGEFLVPDVAETFTVEHPEFAAARADHRPALDDP